MLERMAHGTQAPRSSLALLAAALFAGDCSREPAQEAASGAPPSLTSDSAASIYERAGRTFASVQLLRPQPDQQLPFDVYLAPMIVQELLPDVTGASAFGALALAESGHAEVRAEHSTVYFSRTQASIGGEQRDQLAFVWWYPGAQPSAASAQGVRITLGKTGIPMLWEVLSDESGA